MGNVHYDQTKKGIGWTGYNSQIDYRGFKCWMFPEMFLRLAHKIFIDPEDTNFLFLKNAIRRGKPIASPFFQVTWDDTKQVWEIYGHEGRHRVKAIDDLWPNEQVEVYVIPVSNNLRAKDITPPMLQSFMDGVIAQDKTYVEKPTAKIEHLGKPFNPQQPTV